MSYIAKKPEPIPAAPSPSAASALEGMETARALARTYLPDVVRRLAAIALAPDCEAPLHTRMMSCKTLCDLAGIPQAVPEAPRPLEGTDDGSKLD